jgi:methanogenic corrinoid protein MtbC1
MPAAVAPDVVDQYLEPLLAGERRKCRAIVEDQLGLRQRADAVLHDLIWPAMERVERLYREDRISAAAEHMAVRINRALSSRLQNALEYLPAGTRRILIACAEGEKEEINGQVMADLFEARGWQVYFIGSGVPNDEVLGLVGQLRPEILLICGTHPQGVPQVRALIDLIRDVGCSPTMNILVSGGVFNRADGLWKEVNADLFARTAAEAIPLAESALPRKPEIRIPGAPKKRRRRRPAALLAAS